MLSAGCQHLHKRWIRPEIQRCSTRPARGRHNSYPCKTNHPVCTVQLSGLCANVCYGSGRPMWLCFSIV